ncbi:hypothetical protein N752_06935 [Desulforamulus aquiferis]|nr:hypothetical protein [Desulforamulus aquiferis]RYD05974.1 hypothetical protein N752_06935 [Desulforamulus aquiferis]
MEDIRKKVKERYANAITKKTSCCGPKAGGCYGNSLDELNVITGNLYSNDDLEGIPSDAVIASFGCGNPTALAELYPGEVVLDLGSGAGLDVLLSARRVGPTGRAYGLI